MIGKLTFGEVETRIRRDLLNDFDSGAYRWGVHQVMAAMNIAVLDIVKRYNQWAGYRQDNGRRIYGIDTVKISEKCLLEPSRQGPKQDTDQAEVEELRALLVPIDDRYEEAIALIAAGRLMQIDDSDTENAAKAATFIQQGMEYAQR